MECFLAYCGSASRNVGLHDANKSRCFKGIFFGRYLPKFNANSWPCGLGCEPDLHTDRHRLRARKPLEKSTVAKTCCLSINGIAGVPCVRSALIS